MSSSHQNRALHLAVINSQQEVIHCLLDVMAGLPESCVNEYNFLRQVRFSFNIGSGRFADPDQVFSPKEKLCMVVVFFLSLILLFLIPDSLTPCCYYKTTTCSGLSHKGRSESQVT